MKKLLVALAITCCGGAHAEFWDGNELFARMTEDGTFYKKGTAMGYVLGVYDALQGITHCPPGNVSAGQVYDMVKLHLEKIPAARHLPASSHVEYVLTKAWPCKKGQAL